LRSGSVDEFQRVQAFRQAFGNIAMAMKEGLPVRPVPRSQKLAILFDRLGDASLLVFGEPGRPVG